MDGTPPAGGALGWEFGAYEFPHRAADPPFLNANWGVVERRLYAPGGTAFGAAWTFEPRLETPPPTLPGQPEQPARELVNTVTDPLGHVTEHYFSVYPGGLNPAPAFVQAEYSLPISHYQDDGTGRFLSTRTFDASGQLLRSSFLRYQGGPSLACPNAFNRCPFANARVSSERVVFHDDVDAVTGARAVHRGGRAGDDGAGNLIGMGADWFYYDEASRLVRAGLQVDGAAWEQATSFDRYGGLTSVGTRVNGGAWSFRTFGVSPSTNRILSSQVSYDAEGNLTRWGTETQDFDPFGLIRNTPGRAYLYTADDERLWVFDATSGPAQQVETFTLRDLDGRPLRRYRVATTGSLPPTGGSILFADGFETGDVSCWSSSQGFEGATGTCGQRRWQLERDYVWAGRRLLAAQTPAGVHHFHLDHLGTPRQLTGAAGAVLASHTYFPFGEEATVPTQNVEPLKFTGHERDLNAPGTANDLDYLHARYYKAILGRFLSVDPSRSAQPNQPQTWNRYAYVANNPLGSVDPDGRERAQIILDQDVRAYLNGELTSAEFQQRNAARAAGALTGVSFLIPGPEELALGAVLRSRTVARVVESVGGRLGGFVRRVFGGRRAVEAGSEGAESAANGVRLQKQLASEEQVGELVEGGGQSIAGVGGRVSIRDVERLVNQYGGSPSDWAKIRSSNFKAADGTNFEIHAYRNVQTGEVVELKSKIL